VFQLHILKLIKSQVPFCGRKWRQSMLIWFNHAQVLNVSVANMKVITSIYLNCRPDLRDEWLTGTEVDDASDAQVLIPCIYSYFYDNFLAGTRTCAPAFGQVL
jgi:hypothetical protein